MAGTPSATGSPPTSETAQIPSISTTTPSNTNVSPFARKPLQRSESRSSFIGTSPIANQYPHVYHYINQLFTAAASTTLEPVGSARLAGANEKAHPLSVSSSTGSGSGSGSNSDEEGEAKRRQGGEAASDAESEKNPEERTKSARTVSVSSDASATSTAPSTTDTNTSNASQFKALTQEEKDEVVKNVVDLLSEEKEEKVKFVLKDKLGVMGQICLDLMHKHRDDVEHIPYQSHLAVRPPKASPSMAHALPHRPFTPTRVPSFRSRTPLARSQSPAPPLPGSGIIGQPSPSATPTHSAPGTPTFSHAAVNNPLAQLTAERFLAGAGSGSSASALLAAGSIGGSPKSAHASPATSPKILSAKANLFNPNAPGSNQFPPGFNAGPLGNKPLIALPSPFNASGGDPWAQFGRLASPVGSPALSRTSSNLASAAPLTAANMFAHHASLNEGSNVNAIDTNSNNHDSQDDHRAPSNAISQGGPGSNIANIQIARDEMDDAGVDDIFSTSAMDRHSQFLPHHDDDEEEDEFSPFGTKPVRFFKSSHPPGLGYEEHPGSGSASLSTSPVTKLQVSAKAFDPTKLGIPNSGGHMDPNAPGFAPSPGGHLTPNGSRFASGNASYFGEGYSEGYGTPVSEGIPGGQGEEGGYLGDGMTPLDVLQSVFTTLPAGELEEALVKSGYEFEGAMALLIAQNGGTRSTTSGASTPTGLRPDVHRSAFGRGGGGRDQGYFHQGGRGNAPFGGGTGHLSPRFAMGGSGTRSPGGGLKMCRYYLAGECRRADCRFSHDVDRALCRFWLRGQCAKGDMCEFIHALPNVDPNVLSNQLSRLELAGDGTARSRTPPVDEFPDLNFHPGRGRGAPFDPSRNRFANAVKRPMPPPGQQHTMVTGNRFVATQGSRNRFGPGGSSSFGSVRGPPPAPMPRPSPRIKLRPPTLLPTLPTGAALNEMYLEARQGAIRLGQARNACLARAADAWRRGDGAAAKRFSREANVLNERMSAEGAEAASHLVRQRRAQAQEAIKNRGDWSDDPGDRAIKGKECANGLGVVMGIASASSLGPEGNTLSPEERTEVLLDLHMLHANEGTDVLEDFLLAVSCLLYYLLMNVKLILSYLPQLERDSFLGLAYIIVGEDRHTGSQDPGRGASRYRLATGVKQFLARYNYPWSEGGGCICVDSATHM
ncbi:hypothetical protein QFC19_004172 [Naganishia cerealis]|uniref:Uncharacterized protein n=1 Tax=Naganishia cerealis TaxID=610337 RepID=A0ACC2VXX1_9TREE|nr:hypothetical protein QFC19_004172 [Naganishia cerealis]